MNNNFTDYNLITVRGNEKILSIKLDEKAINDRILSLKDQGFSEETISRSFGISLFKYAKSSNE